MVSMVKQAKAAECEWTPIKQMTRLTGSLLAMLEMDMAYVHGRRVALNEAKGAVCSSISGSWID